LGLLVGDGLGSDHSPDCVHCHPSAHRSLERSLVAKLERVAADIDSGADEYVQQLVEHYLDHDVWFRQKVSGGLKQLDRGEFLTHEEVGACLKKMFQP
jgi:predicted transcriptional regulator